MNTKQIRAAQKSGKIVFSSIRIYLIFMLSFVVLYPLIYMLTMTFRSTSDFIDPGVVWIPKTFSLEMLKNAWEILNYPIVLKNTVTEAVLNTLLMLVSCSLAGYGFARFNFKTKRMLFFCLLVSIIIPTQTIVVPLYARMGNFDFFLFGQIGRIFTGEPFTVNLLNSHFAMAIPAICANGIRGPLYIYIFRQFFSGLPKDLEEAAYIDGAGAVRTYRSIIVPCAMPAFLIVTVLSIIWYWNDVLISGLFYGDLPTLARTVDGLKSALNNIYSQYAIFQIQQASCLLMIAPVLIAYLFVQKYFVESIDKSGLK